MEKQLPPLVSVVILNYNGRKFLRGCLDSVSKTKYENFEVILVDNGSTDGSCTLHSNDLNLPKLIFLKNIKNLGFAGGNNVGALKAHGEYVVFLNTDTEVDEDWLQELISAMEADKNIGAAQCNLLKFDRKTVDGTGDFVDHYGNGLSQHHGETLKKQYFSAIEIFSARGAAVMIRKQILYSVGCFDSSFFMLCEDVDLCWRIRLNGFKVVLVPKSVVYHFGSGIREDSESSTREYYYNTRNGLTMLIKNYQLRNVVRYGLPKIIFQFIFFLFAFSFGSKRRYNLSRITAIADILIDFKQICIKRSWVQLKVRKIPDKDIQKTMIKQNLTLLQVSWLLLYRKKIEYHDYLNIMVPCRL